MKNKFFLIVIIFIFLYCNMMMFSTINADDSIGVTNIEKSSEEINLQRENIANNINSLTEQIRKKVKYIDEKLDNLKNIEEYERYPAIRLNIDTPMFGLKSMVDQKLLIVRGVSTADIALGYSIRDILSTGKIKIPDSQIAGITVSTKDVNLDADIDFLNANISILRLSEYLEQLDMLDEFIDKQIYKTFYGYINKQKKENVDNTISRLDSLSKRLIEIEDKLIYIYILSEDDVVYDRLVTRYNDINYKLDQSNKALSNILISNSSVEQILRDAVTLEADILDFSKEVNDEYNKLIENIDVEVSLIKMKNVMEYRIGRIDSYIEGASEKLEENTNIQETEQNDKPKEYEDIVNYEVVSEDTLSYLNSLINVVISNIDKYSNSTNEDNVDVQNDDIKTKLTYDEKKSIIDQLKVLYEKFLARESKFYLDNVNFLLKDTSSKLSILAKNTSFDVVNQIKYIYLDLPNKLSEYFTSSNLNSKISIIFVINNLNSDLTQLSINNMEITKLYKSSIS